MRLRIEDVGRLLGLELPAVGKRGLCPFQKHRRDDPTFRVYPARESGTGDELYKCWSCDGPEASGDAVKLYSILCRIDRREAYMRLRELGYVLREGGPTLPARAPRTPLAGSRPSEIVPLDLSIVQGLRDSAYARELVALFAQRRRLSPEHLANSGVIGMPRHAEGGAVGFVYTDPSSLLPCRIKVRPLEHKRMYCIPKRRETDPEGAKALAPLYLAERLNPFAGSEALGGLIRVAIVTEGEVDALTLTGCSFPNVVSLPDGAKSVLTADLRPLDGFTTWLAAFDRDQAGDTALVELRGRARGYGVDVVPLRFLSHKDANDAWRAGMSPLELGRCVDEALEERYGYRVPWRRVA